MAEYRERGIGVVLGAPVPDEVQGDIHHTLIQGFGDFPGLGTQVFLLPAPYFLHSSRVMMRLPLGRGMRRSWLTS